WYPFRSVQAAIAACESNIRRSPNRCQGPRRNPCDDPVCYWVSVEPMPILCQRINGHVVWIRNPFTGTHTYFNNIHKKVFSFREKKPTLAVARPRAPEPLPPPSPDIVQQMAQEQARCSFCPGHEAQTTPELLRVTYGEIFDRADIPVEMRPAD